MSTSTEYKPRWNVPTDPSGTVSSGTGTDLEDSSRTGTGTDLEDSSRTGTALNFSGVYVDPEAGGQEALTSLYIPSAYQGAIDAATFLVDIPVRGLGWLLAEGADAFGFAETAEGLRNPLLLGDIVKAGFEAPASIEEAITREPATLMAGFDATPREALNKQEKFWRDFSYISGGALTFPTSLGAAFGTFKAPVTKLIVDASGRGVNSSAAKWAIANASRSKHPGALEAVAKQYAAKFTTGLGVSPIRTVLGEQFIASSAGFGYALPELAADDSGRIVH